MSLFWVLASVFCTWAAVCGKWRNFTWNHRKDWQFSVILSWMQCVPAECHRPLRSPVSFLCGGGMELLIDLWCFHVQTWTLGFWPVWKQVLLLHSLYFSCFQCHCFGAAPRAVCFRYMASSPLCSLGPGLLISAIKRELSRSLIHYLPLPRIIVVLACNWKGLFLPDTWYCLFKCKVTSTALVFIQLHYCLESVLQ